MKPTDKWLIDVKAIASTEGWRHPKTNELLKAMKLDVVEPEPYSQQPTEPLSSYEPTVTDSKLDIVDETVELKPETNEDISGTIKTSKTKYKPRNK